MLDFFVTFFVGFDAPAVLLYIVVGILGLVQGFYPSLSLYGWLKMKLGIEGTKANIMIMALSLIFAVFALAVTNATEWVNLKPTLESILALGGVAYKMAQIGYQKLKEQKLSGPEQGLKG